MRRHSVHCNGDRLLLVRFHQCRAGRVGSTPPTAPAQQAQTGQPPANPTQEIAREQPEGPALEIGPARLRIGGYLGVTGIYRSTNSGGGTGTSFASIPYEDRFRQCERNTAQCAVVTHLHSRGRRLSRAGDTFSQALGLLRNGLQWDDAGRRGGHEHECWAPPPPGVRRGSVRPNVLPGRRSGLHPDDGPEDQLSIWPSDVELSQAVDTNYLAGMIWSRTPQVRFTGAPRRASTGRCRWKIRSSRSERGLVTLPQCCASDIDAQYNTGVRRAQGSNLMPDIVTRVAFNPIKPLHLDVGGVVRVFRHTVAPIR